MTKKDPNDRMVICACSVLFGFIASSITGSIFWHGFTLLGVVAFPWPSKKPRNDISGLLRDSGLTIKRDGQEKAPQILWERETETGKEFGLSLPAGMSSKDFKRREQEIGEALNAEAKFHYHDGKVILNVNETRLKERYDYKPINLSGAVEIPIGYSKSGFVSMSFSNQYSALLIGGASGWGKSVFLRQALTNLIKTKSPKDLKLHLIDLKAGVEFSIFRRCAMVESFADDESKALDLLNNLDELMTKRYALFRKCEVVNISEYNAKYQPLDYHLVVIDEYSNLAEFPVIQGKVDRLLRMCRACGIYFIVCLQQARAESLPGSIKANIQATLVFHTRNELNSRIFLDTGDAAYLRHPGRAIFVSDSEREIQSMYLSVDQARELVSHTYILRPEWKKEMEKHKPKQSEVITLDEWQAYRDN